MIPNMMKAETLSCKINNNTDARRWLDFILWVPMVVHVGILCLLIVISSGVLGYAHCIYSSTPLHFDFEIFSFKITNSGLNCWFKT